MLKQLETKPQIRQLSLDGMCEVTAALDVLASSGRESRGAVFTKREVVDFMLDLAQYTNARTLTSLRLLEPSFGNGDFLLPAIQRLLQSWRDQGQPNVGEIEDCIRGVELHHETFNTTRRKVLAALKEAGISEGDSLHLAECWLSQGDYLLIPIDGAFDIVVGNPPYIRQELIPDALLLEYRSRYTTIYDRADIYIPFIERSLRLLKPCGDLTFICADRWMKNKYGGPLRRLIADHFHLRTYVDMVDTEAFHSDVIAYPSIVVIGRDKSHPTTRAAYRPALDRASLSALAHTLVSPNSPKAQGEVRVFENILKGDHPWILDKDDGVALLRRLEATFPTLEDDGCKVGIGVATGADKAFIGCFDTLDVEPSRKLPLAMTRDILSGTVDWQGKGVINPFNDDGTLVDLSRFPRLRSYLESNREQIAGRHVAQKAPANWYRTIDRITPSLAFTPKLLIPDIKGDAHVVFEEGRLYPHHNLYYITSTQWNLKALQAVLMSGIARLFVAAYSTKMHGGFLRFQAQYLRRIRVPKWADVPAGTQKQLIAAAERQDVAACNEAVFLLYGISEAERQILTRTGVS